MLALNSIQSLVLLPPRPECWDMVCMFYYAWFIQCWALELQVYQTRTLPTLPLPNPDTSFYKMHLQCFFIQEALLKLQTSPTQHYMNSLPIWLFGSCHLCPVSPEF